MACNVTFVSGGGGNGWKCCETNIVEFVSSTGTCPCSAPVSFAISPIGKCCCSCNVGPFARGCCCCNLCPPPKCDGDVIINFHICDQYRCCNRNQLTLVSQGENCVCDIGVGDLVIEPEGDCLCCDCFCCNNHPHVGEGGELPAETITIFSINVEDEPNMAELGGFTAKLNGLYHPDGNDFFVTLIHEDIDIGNAETIISTPFCLLDGDYSFNDFAFVNVGDVSTNGACCPGCYDNMSNFEHLNPNVTWYLYIDNQSTSAGFLDSWELFFCPTDENFEFSTPQQPLDLPVNCCPDFNMPEIMKVTISYENCECTGTTDSFYMVWSESDGNWQSLEASDEDITICDSIYSNPGIVFYPNDCSLEFNGDCYFLAYPTDIDCTEDHLTLTYSLVPTIYTSTDVPKALTGVISSGITVPDSFLISDVNVTFDITHTSTSDVDIYLTSPSSTIVQLVFSAATPAGSNFTNTTIDDEAGVSLSSGTAPFTGSFTPNDGFPFLNGFDGENANGTWTLAVFSSASGTLNSWSITFNTPDCCDCCPDGTVTITIDHDSNAAVDPCEPDCGCTDPCCDITVQLVGCCFEISGDTVYAITTQLVDVIVTDPDGCLIPADLCESPMTPVLINGQPTPTYVQDGEAIDITFNFVDPSECIEIAEDITCFVPSPMLKKKKGKTYLDKKKLMRWAIMNKSVTIRKVTPPPTTS